MRRFAALYSALDSSSGTSARVEALLSYFQSSEPQDAAWALHVLLGKQGRRLITGRRLRQICLEGIGLPEWLFDDCHAQVGDSAETIALLWQQRPPAGPEAEAAAAAGIALEAFGDPAEAPLHRWMEELLPAAAQLADEAQAAAVRRLW
jgi:DNA ligase-1